MLHNLGVKIDWLLENQEEHTTDDEIKICRYVHSRVLMVYVTQAWFCINHVVPALNSGTGHGPLILRDDAVTSSDTLHRRPTLFDVKRT